MEIYNYHPVTGEFLGSEMADESPREPGVYIIPGSATSAPPPDVREGFIRRFVNGAWGYSPVTNPDDKPTPEPVEPEPIDPLTLPLERLEFWLVAAEVDVSKWNVRDRIAAMPEGREKYEAIAYFEDALVYRRHDPLLNQMAESEGITAEQLDALWAWQINARPE